jgi:uncharacterized protein YfkK (UPF0435 family)
MKSKNVESKIASIKIQLKILKASKNIKSTNSREKDLRSLKGVLKGKGKFDIKEIESVKIRFKEEL